MSILFLQDVLPGLLERESTLLPNSRPLTLALLSLATVLVCAAPAGSAVIKVITYVGCLPVKILFESIPCQLIGVAESGLRHLL